MFRACARMYIKTAGFVVGDTKREKPRVMSYLQELAFYESRELISKLNHNDNTDICDNVDASNLHTYINYELLLLYI